MSEPKALTRAERNLAVVQRADERLKLKTAEVMSYQADAADLDDNGVPVDPELARSMVDGRPKGWSPRRYNVARDSRKPEREQPGYLARATRVFESYRRGVEAEKPAPVLNVAVQVNVTNAAAVAKVQKYAIIDVEDDPRG